MKWIRRKISHFFYWLTAGEILFGFAAFFWKRELVLAQVGSVVLHIIALCRRIIPKAWAKGIMSEFVIEGMYNDKITLVATLICIPLFALILALIGVAFDPNRFLRKKNRIKYKRRKTS